MLLKKCGDSVTLTSSRSILPFKCIQQRRQVALARPTTRKMGLKVDPNVNDSLLDKASSDGATDFARLPVTLHTAKPDGLALAAEHEHGDQRETDSKDR